MAVSGLCSFALRYDLQLHFWGHLGCVGAPGVCGVLIDHIPLQGESDIDQLCRVVRVLGSPNEENWPVMDMYRIYMYIYLFSYFFFTMLLSRV